MDEIKNFLGDISGIIGSVTAIFAFLLMLVKPVRQKFKNWIAVTAMTPQLAESIKEINTTLTVLGDEIKSINEELKAHVASNSFDIKNANVAQMLTLRLHLREIYLLNYKTKTLTVREMQDVHDMYQAYLNLGGNNYAHTIYEEMIAWEIRDGK